MTFLFQLLGQIYGRGYLMEHGTQYLMEHDTHTFNKTMFLLICEH